MPAPDDLTGALRAVWEVRQLEDRQDWCMAGWYNVIFGVMTALVFAAYALVSLLGLEGTAASRLAWVPPVVGAYTAVAYATKNVLGLPRPTFEWRGIAAGTFAFAVLFALLGIAYGRGLVTDYGAGVSVVIGAFYVGLGVAVRDRLPALLGAGVGGGATGLLLLDPGPWASTVYGIVVTAGAMVASGAWMLRHPAGPPPRASPTQGSGEAEAPPSDLQQVRETLAALRGHEERVRAREHGARYLAAASIAALAGVVFLTTGGHPAPWLLLGFAAALAVVGAWHQRAGRRHA